jgi:histidinol dehydrogenase
MWDHRALQFTDELKRARSRKEKIRKSKNLRRITILIEDQTYASLMDYASKMSKEDLRRLSVSRAVRKILADELAKASDDQSYPRQRRQRSFFEKVQQEQNTTEALELSPSVLPYGR